MSEDVWSNADYSVGIQLKTAGLVVSTMSLHPQYPTRNSAGCMPLHIKMEKPLKENKVVIICMYGYKMQKSEQGKCKRETREEETGETIFPAVFVWKNCLWMLETEYDISKRFQWLLRVFFTFYWMFLITYGLFAFFCLLNRNAYNQI